MFLVDTLHQQGIGVILDWVPAHFAPDPHGLAEFDGTHLYEPADSRQAGKIPDLEHLCVQLRKPPSRQLPDRQRPVLARQVPLRRPAGRRRRGDDPARFLAQAGEWRPNKFGGDENLEAIAFLERLNRKVHERFPGTLTFAEDATARPHITRPVQFGGLGFDLKWDLGWTFDTLNHYMVLEPNDARRPIPS